jgi:hypothetical protein
MQSIWLFLQVAGQRPCYGKRWDKVTFTTAGELSETQESHGYLTLREAIQEAVEVYVNDHYPVGTCAVYGRTEVR